MLGDRAIEVIFDEADLAARREGWDAARWVRHLAAKLHRHDDVLPPGREPDADPLPRPGRPEAPEARHVDADIATFVAEADESSRRCRASRRSASRFPDVVESIEAVEFEMPAIDAVVAMPEVRRTLRICPSLRKRRKTRSPSSCRVSSRPKWKSPRSRRPKRGRPRSRPNTARSASPTTSTTSTSPATRRIRSARAGVPRNLAGLRCAVARPRQRTVRRTHRRRHARRASPRARLRAEGSLAEHGLRHRGRSTDGVAGGAARGASELQEPVARRSERRARGHHAARRRRAGRRAVQAEPRRAREEDLLARAWSAPVLPATTTTVRC